MAALLSDAILSKHPGMPMKALWEALNKKALVGPEVAVAIVNDPRCGIERRSEVREGEMNNQAIDLTLNAHTGGSTPLILAALAGRDDVMEALLSLNAAVDAKEDAFGYTALHISARTINISAIEFLIANGSDVRAVDKYGHTPLHKAAHSGNLEAMQLLIAKGSDVKAVDKYGYTPLLLAVQLGKPEAIELLVAKGSDIKAVGEDGYTPLHFAAQCRNTEAIELLIAIGSDVNAVTRDRLTPLYVAVHLGKPKATKLLIASGSDVNYTYDGSTPLHEAAVTGEVMKLLLAEGCY